MARTLLNIIHMQHLPEARIALRVGTRLERAGYHVRIAEFSSADSANERLGREADLAACTILLLSDETAEVLGMPYAAYRTSATGKPVLPFKVNQFQQPAILADIRMGELFDLEPEAEFERVLEAVRRTLPPADDEARDASE